MALLGLRDVLFLCICCAVHFIYRYRRKALVPLPPTLPGWPILGNAFQIPLTYAHVFYKELGHKLGSDILYLEALGRSIVVVNDINVAKELLDKRSGLYSSRPSMPMLTEVVGANMFLGLLPYSDKWRNQRRIFQQHFSTKVLPREEKKSLDLIRKALLPNIYRDSEHIHEHVRGCIGGLSVSLTYGLPVQRTDEPLIDESEKLFTGMTEAGAPGKYFVNILPILRYIPDWMPGATFKKEGQKLREHMLEMIDRPFDRTLKQMNNRATESFVSSSIERYEGRSDFTVHEEDIKQVAAQISGAVSETTMTAAMTFILAMLTYPDVQRKAQQELDTVVGSDRLPDFSDKPDLPYLAAVLKEVLRWNPVTPMGIPHMTSKEDIFNGYYIPKDCIVFANTYAMLHDEKKFPNPLEFDPDRFIKDGVLVTDILDPFTEATFGFGRRVCPGSHVALSTLFGIATSILTLFDISPALDAEGKPIKVTPKFISASIVSEPLPFKCKLVPRPGKNVESLLQDYLEFDIIE